MRSPAPGDTLQALQRENERLRRALGELSILNDLAREIGATHDLEGILKKIIRRSLEAVHAEQGLITLVDADTHAPVQTLVRTMAGSGEHQPLHVNQSLLGWMYLHKAPLVINDPRRDERFTGVEWDASIHSVLCVPLLIRSTLRGILTAYNKAARGPFTEDDQRLLSIIASQSAQVIENARLYEEEKHLLRMQEELRLAREIQTTLLPQHPPLLPGYDFAGASLPAQVVGGDYYDFVPLDAGRLALCVGDVSGKGLPASLVMANVQATFRGQVLAGASVRTSLERSNRLLCQSTRRGTFVTFFSALLDTRQHRLHYVNAGHNRPLLRTRDGRVRTLTAGGLVLGFKPDFAYEEHQVDFQPGDVLLVYSDGITEAMNAQRQQFGEERLADLLHAHGHQPAQALLDEVVRAVQRHAGGASQTDDITLLVARRLP